jgi:hypothetical protein
MTPRPCTSLTTHVWSQGETLHLSLPGTDGWYDVFRWWSCRRCGQQTWATGAIDVTTPPLSPAQWQTQADLQQRHGDLYGGAVRQQEGWEQQQRGLSRRLQVPRR